MERPQTDRTGKGNIQHTGISIDVWGEACQADAKQSRPGKTGHINQKPRGPARTRAQTTNHGVSDVARTGSITLPECKQVQIRGSSSSKAQGHHPTQPARRGTGRQSAGAIGSRTHSSCKQASSSHHGDESRHTSNASIAAHSAAEEEPPETESGQHPPSS